MSWKSALLAVFSFAILIAVGAGFGMWMTAEQGGSIEMSGVKQLFVPIVGFLAYILWVAFVLGIFRPWLAGRLSLSLGISIEETLHTGGTEGGGGWIVTSRWSL